VRQGDLVGIFKIYAHRNTTRQAGHGDVDSLFVDKALQKECCRLPLYEKSAVDSPSTEAFVAIISSFTLSVAMRSRSSGMWSCSGPTPSIGEIATKHVVRAVIVASAFYSDNIKRFFDNGDDCFITVGVTIQVRDIVVGVD